MGSRPCVSAIAPTEIDRIKQQAPADIFKKDDRHKFEKQVVYGQFKKPFEKAILKFDIGNSTSAENFVVVKKLQGKLEVCTSWDTTV